jgi:hypothetical protein
VNVRLYANVSTLSLTERLEGGGFQPPAIPAYGHLQIRLKLVETINSAPTLDKRPVHALAARIGWPDRAPVSGSYQLEITYDGDTVTTADIAYNATAAQIASAINTALSTTIAALNPCTVSEYLGLQRIVFADKDAIPEIACVENSLWPQSFVDVDEIDFDEGKAFVLQLRQAPVAEVSSFSSQVPGAPTVTQLQAGSEIDGYAINEIQKLTIPPAFEGGSFVIVRDGKKTTPVGVPATIDDIREAVAVLADEGGSFVVTEVNDGAYIEFQGTMAGIDQDLLTIEVFESPGADVFFALNTQTDAMRTLMRSVDTAGQVRIPLNIHLQITDALAIGGVQKVTISQDLVFIRPVSTGDHNVAASLNWNQPLSRTDYLAHSTDALLIGNRAITKVIGDGAATSFTINHNLLENSQTITANSSTDILTAADHGFVNGDPVNFANAGGALPGGLSANVTYWVIAATSGTFQVAATPGGSAINLTTNGTGTNTVILADGTVPDAVMVQVWKNTGSKELISPSDYTVTRPSNNSVVVSGFATTPTAGQYQVNVMTVGRPATYLAHTHTIAEVLTLQDELDAIKARLAALEANTPSNPPVGSVSSGASISRPLGNVWRVPRARQITEKPGSLLEWRVAGEELGEEPRRPIRLLPAVHDASTESLPSPLPAPGDTYKGRVFSVSTTRTDFPGGGLKSGDFAACDGREWYQVTRQGTTSSYHPTPFEMVLFRTAINDGEFPNASKLELMLGFEAVVFMLEKKVRERLSACHWTLLIESGTLTADTTPGTPGANLGAAFGSPVVLAEQRITLTEIPSAHRFGVVINRAANGALSADKVLYTKQSATTAPSAVPMALRARLVRFDTENDPTDARGVVAVRGLDVGLDGQPDSALGVVKILN